MGRLQNTREKKRLSEGDLEGLRMQLKDQMALNPQLFCRAQSWETGSSTSWKKPDVKSWGMMRHRSKKYTLLVNTEETTDLREVRGSATTFFRWVSINGVWKSLVQSRSSPWNWKKVFLVLQVGPGLSWSGSAGVHNPKACRSSLVFRSSSWIDLNTGLMPVYSHQAFALILSQTHPPRPWWACLPAAVWLVIRFVFERTGSRWWHNMTYCQRSGIINYSHYNYRP